MHSQPDEPENHHESALDAHAIDINLYRQILFDLSQALVTAGLFSFGVAVKFVMKYGHYKDGAYYHSDYAWLFSFGTALSLFTMTASRYIHEWTNYHVYKTCITREGLWLVNFAMATIIILLPVVAVDTESYTNNITGVQSYKRTGLSTSGYLTCVFGCILIANISDFISDIKPVEVLELLEEFRAATKDMQNGVMPDDFDDNEQDSAKLAATMAVALATTKLRKTGSKAMRFSDKHMKRVIKQRLLLKYDHRIKSTTESIQNLGHAGLFSLYQKVVDNDEPNHVLGSKNLASKRWRAGKVGSNTLSLHTAKWANFE